MTPEEIDLAIQAFQLLEPEVQKGIAGLIHLAHKKQLTADDYIAAAQVLINERQAPSK